MVGRDAATESEKAANEQTETDQRLGVAHYENGVRKCPS